MDLSNFNYNENHATNSILWQINQNGYDYEVMPKIQTEILTQKYQQKSITQNDLSPISQYFSAIGLIRVDWKSKNGSLTSINYGTGFAVSNRMVITCTHNIYSERNMDLASEIYFVPNMSTQSKNQTIHKCTRLNQVKWQKPFQTFSYKPTKQQLTVFLLDEGQEIEGEKFIKIGAIEMANPDQQLKIIGYPQQKFYKNINLEEVSAQRSILNGKICNIHENIIDHFLPTQVGHSGSPILAKNYEGEYFAVGIHTHRGITKQYNSGLYFSDQVLKVLSIYEKELNFNFQIDELSIFHPNLKSVNTDFSRIQSLSFIQQGQLTDFCKELNQNRLLIQIDIQIELTKGRKNIESKIDDDEMIVQQKQEKPQLEKSKEQKQQQLEQIEAWSDLQKGSQTNSLQNLEHPNDQQFNNFYQDLQNNYQSFKQFFPENSKNNIYNQDIKCL